MASAQLVQKRKRDDEDGLMLPPLPPAKKALLEKTATPNPIVLSLKRTTTLGKMPAGHEPIGFSEDDDDDRTADEDELISVGKGDSAAAADAQDKSASSKAKRQYHRTGKHKKPIVEAEAPPALQSFTHVLVAAPGFEHLPFSTQGSGYRETIAPFLQRFIKFYTDHAKLYETNYFRMILRPAASVSNDAGGFLLPSGSQSRVGAIRLGGTKLDLGFEMSSLFEGMGDEGGLTMTLPMLIQVYGPNEVLADFFTSN